MNHWKKLVTGTLLATLIWTGAAQAESNPAVEGHAKHHQEHEQAGKRPHLTEEQKQTLQAAGVDFKTLRATHEQIHESMEAIRADKQTLESLINNARDEKLQQQVEADLKPMHETWQQVKELRRQNRALRPEMKAAIDAKDTKKIKEIFSKIEANTKQQQKLVQSVQDMIRAEVTKVQKTVEK